MRAAAIILCGADAVLQYSTNYLMKYVFERQMEESGWTSFKTADLPRHDCIQTPLPTR